jgi:hypothetical protein
MGQAIPPFECVHQGTADPAPAALAANQELLHPGHRPACEESAVLKAEEILTVDRKEQAGAPDLRSWVNRTPCGAPG